jgi:hypothetical protein
MSRFIFMLTRNDETVTDARDIFGEVASTDLALVGFKDVGVPVATLRSLTAEIQDAGKQAVLEVVSLTEEDELRSARVALDLGVDYLIGGTRWRPVRKLLANRNIQYFPYVGKIIGHPAELGGTADEMVAEIQQLHDSVDGINLLAYRHRCMDGGDLLDALRLATNLPILCAGSVDSLGRVRRITDAGAWGFTIGTAVLDGVIIPGKPLREQVELVLSECAS